MSFKLLVLLFILPVLLAAPGARGDESPIAGHENQSGSDGKAEAMVREGSSELQRKRYGRALAWFNAALHRHLPKRVAASIYSLRGEAYLGQGEVAKAFADYNRAVSFAPEDIHVYASRATGYEKISNFRAALADYAKVLELSPDNAYALNELAWLQASCPDRSVRNGRAAVRASTKACELTRWKEWSSIDTLAAAHAEAGDFDQAIRYQEQAMRMKSSEPDDRKGMGDRLALYRRRQPYREDAKALAR